jgi:hypothetical protein
MSDVIVGREGVARHRWTVGTQWPAAGSLYVGEIAVGLADPMQLWVGVPTSLDPSGIRLLYDAQSATEAPADGQVYGRRGSTVSWQAVLPITGGTLSGPLVVPNGTIAAPGLQLGAADGTGISRAANALVFSVQGSTIFGTFAGAAQFYGPLAMLGNKITQLADATAATDALNMRVADGRYATPANIPLASTQPPLMDSAASPGSSAAWSAGDHVHPSDTAKLSLTGGTMSGGIGFGASIGNTPLDFSHHINLWGSQYGISITSNRLNIVAGSNIVMVVGNNTDIGTFSPGGLFMAGTNTVTLGADPTTAMQATTKQYVDTKAGNYVPLAGGTMSGGLGFGAATAASTSDLTRHISLHSAGYGFNVTASRLNLVTAAAGFLVYVNNGNDVFRVNNIGTVTFGYVGNTLTLTPNDGARSGNISFVAAATNSILEFDNPIFLPGVATGVSIGPAIWLGNSSHQIRANTGQDGASMAVANYSLNSWNGIGFGPNISGMPIPQWMYGLVINTRSGAVINYGDMYALNALPNAYSTIQHISIVKSGFDQILQLDGNAMVATLPSATPVAGGSGCNVNDRFYDAYNNTYTATAVTAGAVTAIALNAATARFGGVPANPVALTAAPGFSGTGVQVNLTWVAPTRFVIRAAGGSQSMLLSAAGGITAGNPITLPADPTTALQAATKQYVDAHSAGGIGDGPSDGFAYGRVNAAWAQVLPLTGGTLTGNLNINGGALQINALAGQYAWVILNRPVGLQATIASETAGVSRWQMKMADESAETGSNAGSDWSLNRYDDGGNFLDAPILVRRATANIRLSGSVGLGIGVPTNIAASATYRSMVASGSVTADNFARNLYLDTGFGWRYLANGLGMTLTSGPNGAALYVAASGTAGAPVTAFNALLTYTPQNSLGLGVIPPATQASGTTGGWMFGWGITVGNWSSNGYYDGTNWRYLAAGVALVSSSDVNGWHWSSAPSGAAGAVASMTQVMSLNPTGSLTVNGSLTTGGNFSTASINATGAITAGSDILGASGVYAARATASNFVLYGSSSNLYHQYETGWFWTWNRSSGAL